MNQSKLIKTAKTLDFWVKIVQIVNVIIIGLTLCALLLVAIAYLTIPDRITTSGYESVDAGLVTIRFVQGYVPSQQSVICFLSINSISLLAGMTVLYLGFRYIRKILAQMILGNPFHRSVSDNFKKLSYVTLGYGILGNIFTWINTYFGFYHFGLKSLAKNDGIASVSANYGLDIKFLFVFAVFLLTSYIFRYGSELQQLSDETL